MLVLLALCVDLVVINDIAGFSDVVASMITEAPEISQVVFLKQILVCPRVVSGLFNKLTGLQLIVLQLEVFLDKILDVRI